MLPVRTETNGAFASRTVAVGVVCCALSLSGCLPNGYRPAGGYAPPTRSYASAPQYDPPARQQICARYQTRAGWSHGYLVDGTLISGRELNQRTGTYDYNWYATYVVIFWAQGQASVIELTYFFGQLGPMFTPGTDRAGRQWEVAEGSYLCGLY